MNDFMLSYGFTCYLFNKQHIPQCTYYLHLLEDHEFFFPMNLLKVKILLFYLVFPLYEDEYLIPSKRDQ